MTISSIASSPSYPNPTGQEEPVQSSSQQPAKPAGSDSGDALDTVHLSETAQIDQAGQQGESASVIASTFGLTVSEVDTDLGVSTASSASSSVPVAAPSGQGEHRAAVTPAAAAPAAATPAAATPAAAGTSQSKTAAPAHTLSVRA